MDRIVNDAALDVIFRAPRHPSGWLDRPVSPTLLRAVWELVRLGSVGCEIDSAQVIFAASAEARARLIPALPEACRAAAAAAPVIAIVACASEPGQPGASAQGASLCGACLALAARALGLDCEVVAFDANAVKAALSADDDTFPVFLCHLGYADPSHGPAPVSRPGSGGSCRIL